MKTLCFFLSLIFIGCIAACGNNSNRNNYSTDSVNTVPGTGSDYTIPDTGDYADSLELNQRDTGTTGRDRPYQNMPR